jgi:hypothetical protein
VNWFSLFLALAGWIAIFGISRRILPAVQHTSLRAAAVWLIVAGAAVCLMATTDLVMQLWPDRTADYGWLFASILLLCPPIAVLGSRRPGVRVWSAFILMPMVIVLTWPVWTLLLQRSEARGLALEMPTVIGFGFVLLMGAGNYLGTRFAVSAVLYALSTAMLFASCTGWSWMTPERMNLYRQIPLILLILSASVPARLRFRSPSRHPVNFLWQDFKNVFGNVWSLRMVERINSLAIQEHWTARITYDGIPETPDGRLAANEAEITAACRWLFRRFVDDQWVESHLSDASQKLASTDETKS